MNSMGRCRVLVAICVLGVTAGTAGAETELTLDDLDWPATTASARASGSIEVFDGAASRTRLGKVAKGTRLAWRRIIAARGRCKAWLEIEPRGYVCAKGLRPSDDAPEAKRQGVTAGGRFADVRGVTADAYDSIEDIRAGVAHPVPGTTFVKLRGSSTSVDGVRYKKTDQGWIEASLLRPLTSSQFQGVDLLTLQPPAWPFAWAVPKRKHGRIVVRATASKKGAAVRELEARTLVAVLEEKGKWVRIGDGEWLEAKEVRIARTAAVPDGVADGERWIDVDLDQQVLMAYQGDKPVYATMISSGRKKFPTPTGIYRIHTKHGKTRMVNTKVSRSHWDVADVPWAMKFRKNFALHGAYWHDGFGGPRSHGCVNLAPSDARWLYDWSSPDVPDGWTMVELEEMLGTPVRIHSHRDPAPKWRDWKGRKIKR
jgi:lipoprotein-anchoring transpeptidase ErfK/SrfK